MKRTIVFIGVLCVVGLVIVSVYYGAMLGNEPDSRLHPWSERRDSMARPALPDYLVQVGSRCPPKESAPAEQFSEMHLFFHFSGFPPALPTPPVLADMQAFVDMVTVEWLPLIYMDASDHLYRVSIRARVLSRAPLPLKARVAFPEGAIRTAEAPPFEAVDPTRRIFLSDCWREGRFVPPPNWRGSATQIAWHEFDWVVVCPASNAQVFWVAPDSGQQYVYLRVLRDPKNNLRQAIIGFVRTPERRYRLKLVSSEGETRIVAVNARETVDQPLREANCTLYLLPGEKTLP
ncbi:MAG: hypothetical protein N2045_10605 [Fimbriimonadales bacterium]|jgi:hypothetical protein|nr:hypothetical protein [Armatimonadota bacterium]MCX7688410.1 hypothetical protein [Fimbriimonadales bacterium]GIV12814.1 MAG: hypothetical protein KatS3mg021_1096 [Fimbriimonadales bacterium]CUU34667.1 hypothetical protein DCOP10_10981 [Armatimonadetes bacterium DC]CUU37845.1 hypothetical protein GXSOP10_1355 [Armatimonadetes bacterium GXS]